MESIELVPTLEGAAVEIRTNQPFQFVTYTLSDPVRLVLDPMGTPLRSSLPADTVFQAGLVRGIHLSKDGGDAGIDYLVFDLAEPSEHLLEPGPGKLVLWIRPKVRAERFGGRVTDLSMQRLAAPPVSLRPDEDDFKLSAESLGGAPQPALSGAEELWSLETALEFSLSRHRPLQVGREEIALAEMKLREARRALYPAMTLKYSWTEGTASNVGFTEVTQGLQVEHPLFYSRRLSDAYRQAIVNLQVAEKRQHKVKADHAVEVAQAYYQFIGAQAGFNAQTGVVEEAKEFFEKVRARYDRGLLTKMELMNVESQVNQVVFQRATAENDLALARLKFLQRMKLSEEAVLQMPAQFPEINARPIDLEEALALSNQYRPEILLNRLLVEFNEFEVRIARAKGKLKVDLSGFYGSSGSAFETEDLDAGNDYFIGLKATQAWGPHGASASITETKTSPRLGQTTRTDSTVYAAELGIANQLQGISEVQQARVALEKAKADFEDIRASIALDVNESYIAYNKARIQLEFAKQKLAFREEQLKILKAQSSLNEILPSQVLEAMIRLAEDRVGQIQAMTNYYVALVKLNKAIGLAGHYQ